jgi:hypothetical protein
MAVFIVYSCIRVICELPSLNCSNCGVNPTRFGDLIVYLVVVVRTRKACFGAGLRLPYQNISFIKKKLSYIHWQSLQTRITAETNPPKEIHSGDSSFSIKNMPKKENDNAKKNFNRQKHTTAGIRWSSSTNY